MRFRLRRELFGRNMCSGTFFAPKLRIIFLQNRKALAQIPRLQRAPRPESLEDFATTPRQLLKPIKQPWRGR
jgi:hypothetical protein